MLEPKHMMYLNKSNSVKCENSFFLEPKHMMYLNTANEAYDNAFEEALNQNI